MQVTGAGRFNSLKVKLFLLTLFKEFQHAKLKINFTNLGNNFIFYFKLTRK